MPRNRPQKSSASLGGPGDAGNGSQKQARTETCRARTSLTEWLATDGAPWRPFVDKGELVAARPRNTADDQRPSRAQAFRPHLRRATHEASKAVCLWPARDRDKTWRLGDFSSYSLEFSPAGRARPCRCSSGRSPTTVPTVAARSHSKSRPIRGRERGDAHSMRPGRNAPRPRVRACLASQWHDGQWSFPQGAPADQRTLDSRVDA